MVIPLLWYASQQIFYPKFPFQHKNLAALHPTGYRKLPYTFYPQLFPIFSYLGLSILSVYIFKDLGHHLSSSTMVWYVLIYQQTVIYLSIYIYIFGNFTCVVGEYSINNLLFMFRIGILYSLNVILYHMYLYIHRNFDKLLWNDYIFVQLKIIEYVVLGKCISFDCCFSLVDNYCKYYNKFTIFITKIP